MSIAQSLALAAALMVGLSTLTDAAPRQRTRSVAPYIASGTQYPTAAPVTAGSYGGYSADPHTRALEELADKYRPGW
jgi:hypothetical protein